MAGTASKGLQNLLVISFLVKTCSLAQMLIEGKQLSISYEKEGKQAGY